MKRSLLQSLTETYHFFLLISIGFFAQGCSSCTLLYQFRMGPRPSPTALNDDWETTRKAMAEEMKRIEKENPGWKRAMDNDSIIVDFYEENGKKTGSAIGR